MRRHILWAAFAGLVLTLTASVCVGQDKQPSEPFATMSDPGSVGPQMQLRYFGNAETVPDVGTLTGLVQREYALHRRAVESYFAMYRSVGRRTAKVPVPFVDLELQVNSEYVAYDLFNAQTQSGQVRFGPYIQNWRSARKDYEGHYGLRLHFPW